MVFYAKYNNSRKRQFRLATTIAKTESGYIVTKKAQSKESGAFLASLQDKYDFLVNQKSEFVMDAPISVSPEEASFKYRNGITFEKRLLDAFEDRNINDFKSLLMRYEAILKKGTVEGCLSNEFLEIFSGDKNAPVLLQKFSCLDINFDNIIVAGEDLVLIDYEWTFTFPLPYKYIIFRAIVMFYSANSSKSLYDFFPLSEALDFFKISEEEQARYIAHEYSFQKHVNISQKKAFNKFVEEYNFLIRSDAGDIQVKSSYIDTLHFMKMQLEQSVEYYKMQLRESQKTIEWMENSKYWRLRGQMDRFKFGFFHPVHFLKKQLKKRAV